MHHKIKFFTFIDPESKAVVTYSVRALMSTLALRSIRSRVQQRLNAISAGIHAGVSALQSYTAAVASLPRRLGIVGPRYDKRAFAHRVQRMFRLAQSIGTGATDATDTIVLAISTLGPGGAERQAVNTAIMIKRIGRSRPVVVCARLGDAASGFYPPTASGFYRPTLEKSGIEVIDLYQFDTAAVIDGVQRRLLDLCRLEGAMLGYGISEDLFRYLTVFLKLRPKVVHSSLDDTNVVAGIAAVLARVPRIVLKGENVAPDKFITVSDWILPGYRTLLRNPGIVFCNNSRAGAADYRRWLKRRRLKIDILHNGVDFETFAPRAGIEQAMKARLGIPPQSLVVGTVMRFNEEKQPALWVRVATEISRRRPDVEFVLVGDGPLRGDTERAFAMAGIETRVHFIGLARDVARVLGVLDVFLLTSRIEGVPNVLIEAQAVGVPVVTTPAGGAAEALEPNVTGLVTPDHSVLAVANTCLTLLDDDELRARMGKAAPDFVRKKFSLDRMIRDTVRLYEEDVQSIASR
jgi:glycosyltransferase involved in cell wall biosynthesis